MEFSFDSNILHNFSHAIQYEWLETNGLGGWAGSTIIGANTRKYHGLLIAAARPPVGRQVLVSKMDETLILKREKIHLGSNQYPGAVAPYGHVNIQSFKKDLFPEFIYNTGKVGLKKTIAAIHGQNTTVILYEVIKASEPFDMELLPLVAGRDYHSLSKANDKIDEAADFIGDTLSMIPYQGISQFWIRIPGSEYLPKPDWYYNFEYEYERNRGLENHEDLFTPGRFVVQLEEGQKLGIILSTDNPTGKDAFELFEQEKQRRQNLIHHEQDDLNRALALAADQFIVKRGENLKTIIAGYPWFADWGRDTMIALPGLCLSTRRYDDAKNILRAFAEHVSQGMLPNRFPDYGEEPEYNTADATLWFFVATYRYYKHTKDKEFLTKEILPVLKDILEWHIKGTRYNIKVDRDGLLNAGDEKTQLTWMDAKVGDWVVTPRHGKPVEINALWYNALMTYSQMLKETDQHDQAVPFLEYADKALHSFNEQFWNEEKECLFDCIRPGFADDSIRPNQIFALSLPFPLITGLKAQKILKVVEEKLYTPVGLRSLSKEHKDYRSVYEGDIWSRDGAYHQGTVWSWPIGAYIDALMEVRGATGRRQAVEVIQNFRYHLSEAGLGSVSEIFDGKYPHTPKGCPAQAWGVAEVLRTYTEYRLRDEN